MYQSTGKPKQRLCSCTGVFHAFKKKEECRGEKKKPVKIQIDLRVFLMPLNCQ